MREMKFKYRITLGGGGAAEKIGTCIMGAYQYNAKSNLPDVKTYYSTLDCYICN